MPLAYSSHMKGFVLFRVGMLPLSLQSAPHPFWLTLTSQALLYCFTISLWATLTLKESAS